MKIRQIFFVTIIVLLVISTAEYAFAQRPGMLPPIKTSQNPPIDVPNECNDGKDNGDGDNLADAEVPECKTGIKCEDGTTKCVKQATTTPAPASGASDFNLKVRINNPLKVDTIEGAIKLFMDAVLRIAIPFIVIFFIWSGLSFVLARGNPDKIKVAKNMFWYTIIGTLLILGAWTITNAIIGTVNSVTG